jgi:hypothetical protein
MGNDSVSRGRFLANSAATGSLAQPSPMRATAPEQTASANTLGQLPKVAVRKATLKAKSLSMSQVRLLQGHRQHAEHHRSCPYLRDRLAKG